MPETTTHEAPAYTLTARILHWATAAIVLTMIPVGFVMANVDLGTAGDAVYDLHKSMGAVLLPLVIVRLIYRFMNPPPSLPADIPAIQKFAAEFVHWALYVALIIQGILGWIGSSAYRAPIPVFWLFELPPIWTVDQPFSERIFLVHRNIGILLSVLICMHVGAALFHYFVRRDRVLQRMTGGGA